MSNSMRDQLKQLAKEYSRYIVSGVEDKTKLQSIREELGFKDTICSLEQVNGNVEGKRQGDAKRVGIWEAQLIEGKEFFVRSNKYSREFQFWARVDRIPPKSDKVRVAFFGESAARGFLYDPYFTPASFLEKVLNENLNFTKTEVIDLARTSIRIEQLQELCLSSGCLQPDIIVVFAGNNWRESLLTMTDSEMSELCEALNKPYEYSCIKNIIEAKYTRMISTFTETLNNISKENNIPIVLIIPDFNLKDWKSNFYERNETHMAKDISKWLNLKASAERALLAGSLDTVEALAKEMTLVNETNPLSYELLAECNQKKGLVNEERKNLEAARDTSMFRLNNTPVCISYIRETLLKYADKYNFNVVDLPTAFSEHLDGGIPGNDLFIDYCHMTDVGIKVAMKYTAQSILSTINKDGKIKDIKVIAADVDDNIKGKAHLFAAIHCAHRGDQSYETLLFHCLEAAKYSKANINLMRKYVDMATRKVPWIYNKNYISMVEEGGTSQYPIIMQPNDCRIMDVELVNAMINVLRNEGIDIKDEVDKLRISEHYNEGEQTDLLESYYKETSYVNSMTISGSYSLKSCYYTSYYYKSRFYLIADNSKDIILELTFRTPIQGVKEKEIYIKVNGHTISKTSARLEWQDLSIIVDRSVLISSGINQIEILWPHINCNERSIEYEAKGIYSDMELLFRKNKLVFGQIFSFAARPTLLSVDDLIKVH